MSFVDMDMVPDDDQRLAQAIGDDVEAALGEAVDLATKIKIDLIAGVKGGLFDYIKLSREVAISSIARIPDIKCEDEKAAIALLRDIQRDMDIYSRAVAFAQNAVTGYIGRGDGVDDESVPENGAADG